MELNISYNYNVFEKMYLGPLSSFFVILMKGTYKTIMTTRKIIVTPITKEPKINHALAASSAFNLKLWKQEV